MTIYSCKSKGEIMGEWAASCPLPYVPQGSSAVWECGPNGFSVQPAPCASLLGKRCVFTHPHRDSGIRREQKQWVVPDECCFTAAFSQPMSPLFWQVTPRPPGDSRGETWSHSSHAGFQVFERKPRGTNEDGGNWGNLEMGSWKFREPHWSWLSSKLKPLSSLVMLWLCYCRKSYGTIHLESLDIAT